MLLPLRLPLSLVLKVRAEAYSPSEGYLTLYI